MRAATVSATRPAPPIDLAGRLALRPVEAAEALGVSERKLRQLLQLLCARVHES